MPTPLDSIIIVLVEPQSVDNIGATLRAMRVMGLTRLRLVRPAPYDAARLPVIAHRAQALIDAMQTFDDLAAALTDAVYVVGCTARRRAARRPVLDPAEATQRAVDRAASGPAAFLFGREDTGLANADLDHCHALLTIPTDPAYPSLNLAQAVMVVAYEARRAWEREGKRGKGGQGEALAVGAESEAMFAALEEALRAVDFLVPSRAEATQRALRALLLRAEPTQEEAALVTAFARAVAGSRRSGKIVDCDSAKGRETGGAA